MTAASPWIMTTKSGAGAATGVVGGKAASLLRLTELGYAVPPFFVITAQAYRDAADGRVSAELARAIAETLASVGGASAAYAVRSSSVAEDAADHSFAGVFDTLLDVTGLNAIVAAIERCWQSHRTAHAAAYRNARGVDSDSAMAVIVQRLVRPDWAGVSFSADPVTLALSVCVINAVPGFGEALMSGSATPEQIRVDAATGKVMHIVPVPGKPRFPSDAIAAVAALTRSVADRYGFPQDIEWAMVGQELFVLQSRPITNIAGVFYDRFMEPWGGSGTPDDPARVWSRAYADEIWTPPVTPLFYDIQNLTAVTTGRIRNDGDHAPLPGDMFKYFRAAPYIDVEVLCRLYAGVPRLARLPSLLAMLPPESVSRLRDVRWRWSGALRRAWTLEVRQGKRLGLTRCHRFLERSWPAFLTRARALCAVEPTVLTDGELEGQLGQVWSLALSVAPECEVAVLYYAHDLKLILSGLLERWFGDGDTLYGKVSSGLDHSETVRENDALWSIADTLRGAGAAAQDAALRFEWPDFRRQSGCIDANGAVGAFEEFLRQHEHRGANYKDLIHPRWGDDPNLLWGHVKAFLSTPGRRPLEANAEAANRRRAAQESALRAPRGPLAPIRRTILRRLFRLNEIYAGIRDNHRYYYDYVWYLVRRHYGEVGRRLAARSLLSRTDDVWFLVRQEIAGLSQGTLAAQDAAVRIDVRRREWQETRIRQPPRFLRNGYVGDDGGSTLGGDARRLCGLGASAGQVQGRVRVLNDVRDLALLQAGEILVARQTDPGWTPAFARIAGLVLETGGVLAHGASLCREYGLPCVTAVDSACTVIRDGEVIRVDGGAGTVDRVTVE